MLVDAVKDVSADVVGGTAIVGASTELVTSRYASFSLSMDTVSL